MIIRRLFSSSTICLAKRNQLAIKRKKANIARQAVLQAERSPINIDPIIGADTEFTRSLLIPSQVFSSPQVPSEVDVQKTATSIDTALSTQSTFSFSDPITALSLANGNAPMLRVYNTQQAISQFSRKEGDTGSAEVQAAVLTVRIRAANEHLRVNRGDYVTKRGLRGMIHARQKMLKYLRKESVERYFACIAKLGLSDAAITREFTM